MHVLADLLLQLFCVHNEAVGGGGRNSILSNEEINTKSRPFHVRSYISFLNSDFGGALCLAEKWLKHEISHSLPSIVRLRICTVVPSIPVQSASSCTGDQQRVYFQFFKIYNNVTKASFFTCLTKQRISTKRRFSAFLHHKLVKIFRRIVTLPSSGWMNFVRVNVDVIWSRWYIDCRRYLGLWSLRATERKVRTDCVRRHCKIQVPFFRSSDLTGFWQSCYYRNTAHETAICRNPPLHSFTGNETCMILNIPSLCHVKFSLIYKDMQFICGHNILTEGVFVTQRSSNAWISVSLIVWVMTNCRFISCTIPSHQTQFSIYMNQILSHRQCRQHLPPK